jgi:hypothetical protein
MKAKRAKAKKKLAKPRVRRKPRVTPEQKGLQVLLAEALNRETPPTVESVHRAIREERLAERLGEDTIQFIAGVNELAAPPQGAPEPAVVSQQIRILLGNIWSPEVWFDMGNRKVRRHPDVPIRHHDFDGKGWRV